MGVGVGEWRGVGLWAVYLGRPLPLQQPHLLHRAHVSQTLIHCPIAPQRHVRNDTSRVLQVSGEAFNVTDRRLYDADFLGISAAAAKKPRTACQARGDPHMLQRPLLLMCSISAPRERADTTPRKYAFQLTPTILGPVPRSPISLIVD